MWKTEKFKLLIFIFFVVSILFVNKIEAASLSVSVNPSSITVGDIVPAQIIVNTNNKFINNAEAIILFPNDLLEVVSITKNSSIFSLWVEEPNFANNLGRISFNGGIPNPGFNGQNGYIITITFKAKKEGSASIIFTDASVRLNDGFGTDVLVSKNPGHIQINKMIGDIPVLPINNLPPKPIIISDSHINQNSWYNKDTANFNWNIPNGVISLKTLLNKIPDSIPTSIYDNSVSQMTLSNLSEGIHYFHLRYYNAIGGGPIAQYKIQIDKTPPSEFTPTTRFENYQAIILLKANDKISGINHYKININKEINLTVRKEELINDEYILPVLSEGVYDLIISAYDKAGNKTEASLALIIPEIDLPIISLDYDEIISGQTVIISGSTNYPNREIEVIMEAKGKEIEKYNQTISNDGTFTIVTDKIKMIGSVSFKARLVFNEEVKSSFSEKIYLKVNETKVVRITMAVFYRLLAIILISILLLGIFLVLYLGWHKYFGLKKKVQNEAKHVAIDIHKKMLILGIELKEQLESLEKIKKDRELNKKEEEIFSQIAVSLGKVDKFIEDKLRKLM